MKPKLILTIVGAVYIFQSIMSIIFARAGSEAMFNVGEEAIELAILFQYGVGPVFLMIGLMSLFSRNFKVESQRKIMLAVIIGYIPFFAVFYYFSNNEMINMSLGSASLDIILFLLLIVSYIKSKKNRD